jgi:hypothetical protein
MGAQQQDDAPLIKYGVSRTIKTVNYQVNTWTQIDFVGTELESRARGKAKIYSTPERTLVVAEVEGLLLATKFGPEYLTYVLWAVTPDGRATNLGQFVVKGSKTRLNVTARLQTFGLIVTAEPYFAVTNPSDVVVLENAPRPDTKGGVDVVEAKYELLQRGQYRAGNNIQPFFFDLKTPMDLYEARNARRIAEREGADRYAPDSWAKAVTALDRAEDYLRRKQKNAIPSAAREATQTFEDARIITIRRKEEERLAQEQREAAERVARAIAEEARARAEAEAATRRQQEEKAARLRAERQKAEADAGRQAALAKEREAAGRAQLAETSMSESPLCARRLAKRWQNFRGSCLTFRLYSWRLKATRTAPAVRSSTRHSLNSVRKPYEITWSSRSFRPVPSPPEGLGKGCRLLTIALLKVGK